MHNGEAKLVGFVQLDDKDRIRYLATGINFQIKMPK